MITSIYRFISLNVWGNLPSQLQRLISKAYASLYNKSFTKYIIRPYCQFNYKDQSYLQQFRSESGREQYRSFQDFFTRVYKQLPKFNSEFIWPCEGLLCDYGRVGDLGEINVKGDKRSVRTIFGKMGRFINDNHYFSNVFLHNNNYHRIHSSSDLTLREIEHIKGDLVLLRPWVYKHDPSLPALRNERINLRLEDRYGQNWFISIVGGPAVGTIVLDSRAQLGHTFRIGDELGKFLLGSTCCMASPVPMENSTVGDTVYMGEDY